MSNSIMTGHVQAVTALQRAKAFWPGGNYADQSPLGRPGQDINGAWMCQSPHPQDNVWICSLADKHPGDHKAYRGHTTNSRGMFVLDWPNLARKKVNDSDVAEAIASIQKALAPKVKVVTPAAAVQTHVWSEDDDYYLVGPNLWERCESEDHDHGILTREELVDMLNEERRQHGQTLDQLTQERQDGARIRGVLDDVREALAKEDYDTSP